MSFSLWFNKYHCLTQRPCLIISKGVFTFYDLVNNIKNAPPTHAYKTPELFNFGIQ